MAHLVGFWHEFVGGVGNKPGAQQGDVVLHFASPVEGMDQVVCPSADVQLVVEAGNFIAVMTTLGDGRSLFVPAGNLAGMIDAPQPGARVAVQRGPGRPAARAPKPD
jgi:hypothetical protein